MTTLLAFSILPKGSHYGDVSQLLTDSRDFHEGYALPLM